MKKLSVIAFTLAALFAASTAQATVVTGKVTSITTAGVGVDDNKEMFIKVTPISGTFATCATSVKGQVWFTKADLAHPYTVELLTAAYVHGKTVKFTGINLCKDGAEMLKEISLQ